MAERDNLKAGERRVATILFSDMKGFTSLSERMDPEEMDALMTRVFGLFEDIIREHGGTVEKYIGDALVAVFGVPEVHEDDPGRAVHAALEFLSRIKEENARLSGRELALSFRTGIHTGLVTTGRRGDYDVVTGHAMSVAQRLESAAPSDAILVSEATKEKCESDFEFEEPFELVAKGKTESIRAFPVKGELSDRLVDSQGPFVGRRESLDELLRAYIRNRYDEVSGYVLLGDPGIGKSRLAQALVEKIRQFPDFRTPVLAARAQKYRPGGFALVADLILGYFGLDAGSSREEILAALGSFPGIGEEARQRFAVLVCCTDPEKPEPGVIAALFEIFNALLERHALDLFPILVVLDNAAFMDRLSREFFLYLFRNGRVKPFFVLASREFPPELRKAFQGLKPLKLGPLSEAEAAELVRAHWPEAGEEGIKRILGASMGNPLFLREYAAYARKHKDVTALPATVQNLFLSTLERYPASRRDLLKKLSVFVHSFRAEDARTVEEATRGSPGDAHAALEAFVRDGLLYKEKDHYLFKADVFKTALYASLLNHNKRILHGIVANILLDQERPHRIRLIYHLVKSERYEEAAKAMQEDPNRHYSYEYLPYIDLLHRRLEKDEKAAVRLLITKAALLFNAGRMEESEEVLKRIMRSAVSKRDDNLMGYAYHQVCAHNALTYSFQKAILAGRKALHYYRRSDVAASSAQNVIRTMSLACVQRGDLEEARRLVEQCEAVPEGDRFEAASCRAEYQLLTGAYGKALATARSIMREAPEERFATRFFAGDLEIRALWQLCDFEAVGAAARGLLSLAPLSGSTLSQANAMLALASVLSGEREAARDAFAQAEFYAEQVGNDFERIDALRTLALAKKLAGDAKGAEKSALEGLTLGLRHSCYWPTFSLLVLLAESSLERGKDERARFFLTEASYLFTAGVFLPSKDLILYYYLAAQLLAPRDTERHLAVAARLLEEEKSRIADPELVANFMAIRSYARLQRDAEGIGGGPAPADPAAAASRGPRRAAEPAPEPEAASGAAAGTGDAAGTAPAGRSAAGGPVPAAAPAPEGEGI